MTSRNRHPDGSAPAGVERTASVGRGRRQLDSWLPSWPVGHWERLLANCTRDRMVNEPSGDTRDPCNVRGPSAAMDNFVPGVLHELEIRRVVDTQLGDSGSDELEETIALLRTVRGLRDRLNGNGVVDETVDRTDPLGDRLEVAPSS